MARPFTIEARAMRFPRQKSLVYLAFIALAIVAAGLYGSVHNQISYSVSPEYFTRFKFAQFGLAEVELPERVRASMVGLLASWWMGVPIGMLVGLAGFIHSDQRRMFRALIASIFVVVGFTLLFGVCGLVYGITQTARIDLDAYRNWRIPSDVVHIRRYLCAGYMHNAAYLGGAIAIFVAWVFHLIVRFRSTPTE